MDISHKVASKLNENKELLKILRNAENPTQPIAGQILLSFHIPPDRSGDLKTMNERLAYWEREEAEIEKIKQPLKTIDGLNLNESIQGLGGMLSLHNPTVEALVEALGMDFVTGAEIDAQRFFGAGQSLKR